MIKSRSVLPSMKNISDKICTENQNITFLFNIFFFPENLPFLDNVEEYGTPWQAIDDNIVYWRWEFYAG